MKRMSTNGGRRLAFLWMFAGCAVGAAAMDFDGDGKSDHAVYYSEAGTWYVRLSATNALRQFNWGWEAAEPVPGDYDGDGRIDAAVYAAMEGQWYILRSSDSTLQLIELGGIDDAPVPGDYDGDGRTDPALYNRMTGEWTVLRSSDGQVVKTVFGWFRVRPVQADYDGDGVTDFAVYRPDTGDWFILASTDGFRVQNFGYPRVRPVPADYDGDGRADLAVYDRTIGRWYIVGSQDGFHTFDWGFPTGRAVPGDYDGDGRADLAVYERATGLWHIRLSSTEATWDMNWGWTMTTPLPSYSHGGIEGLVVLCFGDSITYGMGSQSNGPATGFPLLLKRLLGPALGGHFDTINAGVPGETTSRGLKRLPQYLDTLFPDLMLLMEGTNDHFMRSPASGIVGNLREMIERAHASGAQSMISTIPPVVSTSKHNRAKQASAIRGFNPRIYALAAEMDIPVAHAYEAIASQPEWERTLIDLSTANHPNDEGYRLLAHEFLNALRTAQSEGRLN